MSTTPEKDSADLSHGDEDAAGSSHSDGDNEKTIIEHDSVAELREEIRTLKLSLKMFMQNAATPQPTVYDDLKPPSETTSSSYSLQMSTQENMAASSLPIHNKISIGQFSLPQSYSPYFSNIYMPQPSVSSSTFMSPFALRPNTQTITSIPPSLQTKYMPPPLQRTPIVSSQQTTNMPPSQQTTYTPPSQQTKYIPPSQQTTNMPPSQQTTNMPPSQQTTYTPPSQQTTYTPPSQQTTYTPQSQQTTYTPPSQQTTNMTPQQSRTFSATSPMTTTPIPANATGATASSWTTPYQPFRKLYDLPEFNGQPEQWPMFSVSYKETTQYYRYTNLENLSRLQKSLKGEAKARVEAFLIHPEGVDQVMNTLEFHYGRPHIMIRSQISKVRAFPAISGRKISEIVNFSTMVSNLTVFLENAGATPHLCNPTLLDELVNKLPLTKREEWVKYSMNSLSQYPSVRQFSEWLQNVAIYVSLATETDSNNDDTARNKGGRVKPSFSITTEERLQPNCIMCHNKHYLNQCAKFRNTSTSEKWNLVKDNHLCFCCLLAGHTSFKCNNRRQCGVSKCTKYHNRLLHEEGKFNNNANVEKCKQANEIFGDGTPSIIAKVREIDKTSVTTIIDSNLSTKTLFKFLPVKLKGPKGTMNIMAFVDEGSKVSLLEEDVARQIGLQGPKSNLSLGWIGGKRSNEMSMRTDLEICNVSDNKSSFQMKNVRTTGHLRLPPQSLPVSAFKLKFPLLENIVVEDYYEVTPKLLIGLPHVKLVRPHQVINLDENFSVHRTILGNILFGSNEESVDHNVYVIEYNALDDIKQQVSDYFSLESFGTSAVKPIVSDDDKRAEEILACTTVKKKQQYETGLLWKQDKYDFTETFSLAYKRLQGVESKMKKDEDLAKWYNDKIDDYVSKGYAKKLSAEEASIETDRTWYLPHFVITNVNKGNKRRLVFDAAASVNGESFNSRLLKGPAKYQPKPLLAILFKFRQRQIGVCGDIREMFHRIQIREQDQTAQRFLWRSGVTTNSPDIYVMQAMIFGSASSPCSAQYIKNLNAKNYEETDTRACRAIVDCHYVDDYVDSFNTIEEAITVTKSVVNIHKQAGFELRGFVSNSPEFCHAIQGEVNTEKLRFKNLSKGESMTEKVLGLFWSPKDDSFCFILKFSRVPEAVLSGSRKPTKSEVLSLVMSIFDPFGFLANVVIRSKIILQEVWMYDIDWSSQIPEELYKKWHDWYRELQNVRHWKIPRCYGPMFADTSSFIELHIFADASEVAFAAVGYWRTSMRGNVEIKFVAGKSKCAPIKPLSVPRLELQAAVLGVRLKEAIISSHDIKPQRTIFWSDSKTVVQWIQSDSRIYKQFVSHRIAEILETSEVNPWRWVPGSQNPADDATRPQYFSGNTQDSRWLNGPKFLRSDEKDWPKFTGGVDKQVRESEMRSKFLATITEVDSLIPYEVRSKYYTLLRIRCWLVRAIQIFKCFASHRDKSALELKPYLTAREIKEAEIFWCQIAQREYFGKEYDLLKSNKSVSLKSHIYKLSPCLGEDGLIRISGRISNAVCVGQCTKQPIIMPKNHTITRLIVAQYHDDFRHQNQEYICAAIRTKFWIPSLRQLVRTVKKNCQQCKNRSAAPKPPLMGQLPVDRISPFVRPFTYTGVDYLGPFLVSIGRRCEKRWVALFTCMTTRAIHLELARDLSTDAVILCIRNFINRRGVPVRIRSDRGTNFIGASKEEYVVDKTGLADECTRRGIEWVFNTPADPSSGGAWERMVRAVKNVLAFTLKEKSPQVDTLNSLLIEAENLVNSRPLTHLPVESSDADPLTPNHFLLGCANIVQTPAVGERVCLRKQWHILQQLKQSFWKRWVLEYLPDLTRRTKWYQPVKPIEVGDVVVICDDTEARGQWKRGVVVQVFKAVDGQVRSAMVKTSVGQLRRPASKLAVLDVVVSLPDRLTGGGML